MKRALFTAGLAMLLMTVSAQETSNSYIVKTKNATKKVAEENALTDSTTVEEEEEELDFVRKNFKYRSLCDWKAEDSLRFMVMPEKYDMVVKTFCDATSGKEVSSMQLRHKIMLYKGVEETKDGRWRMNFLCEDTGKDYYYEIPSGSFYDYCYGKLGVPTLAFLGDVDKAREVLPEGKLLFTKTKTYRVDTDSDSDGFRELYKDRSGEEVKVVSIGVGTRSFPVKIIVEDKDGNQFYQVVAMSKTNSGMRDDEFIVDSVKHTFDGAFELQDALMKVNKDFKTYVGQMIHNKFKTEMITKGDGKERHVVIPKMMSFRVDNALDRPGSDFVTLTLSEVESRRIFYKEVVFKNPEKHPNMQAKLEDYFGYLFAMGEGLNRETTQAARAAIQQGRVILGMTEDEVILAMGEEPVQIVQLEEGRYQWLYKRSKGMLIVRFGRNGLVEGYTTPGEQTAKKKRQQQSKVTKAKDANERLKNGTPLEPVTP